MQESIFGHGFQVLHIMPSHTQRVAALPFHVINGKEHRDPFDRLLISQAMTEQMSVISNDHALSTYGVPIVW